MVHGSPPLVLHALFSHGGGNLRSSESLSCVAGASAGLTSTARFEIPLVLLSIRMCSTRAAGTTQHTARGEREEADERRNGKLPCFPPRSKTNLPIRPLWNTIASLWLADFEFGTTNYGKRSGSIDQQGPSMEGGQRCICWLARTPSLKNEIDLLSVLGAGHDGEVNGITTSPKKTKRENHQKRRPVRYHPAVVGCLAVRTWSAMAASSTPEKRRRDAQLKPWLRLHMPEKFACSGVLSSSSATETQTGSCFCFFCGGATGVRLVRRLLSVSGTSKQVLS